MIIRMRLLYIINIKKRNTKISFYVIKLIEIIINIHSYMIILLFFFFLIFLFILGDFFEIFN